MKGQPQYSEILRPERSGVFVSPSDVPALRRATLDMTFAWMELDGAGVRDKDELLEACAFSFDFPDSFGSNWDALSDCLRDFSWRAEQGYVIFWHGAAKFAEAAPEVFSVALEIFRDTAIYWKEHGRTFLVLLDQPIRGSAVSRFPRS